MALNVTTVIESPYISYATIYYPTIISGTGQFVSSSFTGSSFYNSSFHGTFGIFNPAILAASSEYAFVYNPTTGDIGTNTSLPTSSAAAGKLEFYSQDGEDGTDANGAASTAGQAGGGGAVWAGDGGDGGAGGFFFVNGSDGADGGYLLLYGGNGGLGGATGFPGDTGGDGGDGGFVYINAGAGGTPGASGAVGRDGNVVIAAGAGAFSSKVGIGTSIPNYKLDVSGTFRVTSASAFDGGVVGPVEFDGACDFNANCDFNAQVDFNATVECGGGVQFLDVTEFNDVITIPDTYILGNVATSGTILQVGKGWSNSPETTSDALSIATAHQHSASLELIQVSGGVSSGFGTPYARGFRWVYSGDQTKAGLLLGEDSKLHLQACASGLITDGKRHGFYNAAEPYMTFRYGIVGLSTWAYRYIGIQTQNPPVELAVSGAIHCSTGFRIRDSHTPTDTHGVAGDLSGSIAWDSDYLYVCVDNYSDGLGDIWGRVALTFAW